jgi:hypothetical protein
MRGCHMHGKPFLRAAWDEPMQAVGFFRACLTIIAGHMLPGIFSGGRDPQRFVCMSTALATLLKKTLSR